MPMGVWYPTAADAPATMRYESYVGPDAVAGFRSFLSGAGIPDSAIAAILTHPMRAASGAAPSRGRAPVVLLAPGNGDTLADVAFLGELLAAHGYVAVAVPSPTRLGDSLASERDIGRVARVQANDLAFALRTVRADPTLRIGEAAVVGHSFGARAALLLALGRPVVKAVVSLDGGIGTATGHDSMHEAIGSSPVLMQLGAPLLHLYERRDAYMAPDFSLLRATQTGLDAAPIRIAEAKEMRHVHFSSIGDLAVAVPALAERTGAPAGLAADLARVRATVLWFLDRELKGREGEVAVGGLEVVGLPLAAP